MLPFYPGMLIDDIQLSPNSLYSFLVILSFYLIDKWQDNLKLYRLIIVSLVAVLGVLTKQHAIISLISILIFLYLNLDIKTALKFLFLFFIFFILFLIPIEINNNYDFFTMTFIDLNRMMKFKYWSGVKRFFSFLKFNFFFVGISVFGYLSKTINFRKLSIWQISFFLHIPFLTKLLTNPGGGQSYFLTFWITGIIFSVELIEKAQFKLPSWLNIILFLNIIIGFGSLIHEIKYNLPVPTTELYGVAQKHLEDILSLKTCNDSTILTRRNVGSMVISKRFNIENEGAAIFDYAWKVKSFNRNILSDKIKNKKFCYIFTGVQAYPDDVQQLIDQYYEIEKISIKNLYFNDLGNVKIYRPKI